MIGDTLRAECDRALADVATVSSLLHQYSQLYSDRAVALEDEQCGPDSVSIRCAVRRNGRPGRPIIVISKNLIELLIDQGYSCMLLVPECWVYQSVLY